jgi:hypothetical protein
MKEVLARMDANRGMKMGKLDVHYERMMAKMDT